MSTLLAASLIAVLSTEAGRPRPLDLPARPASAPAGSVVARSIEGLPLREREERIVGEILAGNVPSSTRRMVPVTLTGDGHAVVVEVAADYLAVGSDDDSFLTPLTPGSAQRVADRLGCMLPTTKIVDAIHAAATMKLDPIPIPPSPEMVTVPIFLEHNRKVAAQRAGGGPAGLTAGHKKDVVIANRGFERPGRVAIYGWHKPEGVPIQPLYAGHVDTWVDYSHGVRLVRRAATVDGESMDLGRVLSDPALAPLVSSEGVMPRTRYATAAPGGSSLEELRLDRGVRVVIDRPEAPAGRPALLVCYALPNGNSIEQTMGRRAAPGPDWRFDIQHIGAQTRFVREALSDQNVIVAYLENDLKSWPAWRRKHGDDAIAPLLARVRESVPGARLILSGHSGGGSLILGYIDALESIPDDVERLVFLDANYAYDTGRHLEKLARWLARDESHRLIVFAYDDARALLDGKPFVSAEGGTWGRSRRMLADLRDRFPMTSTTSGDLTRHESPGGRITLLLLENPGRKVLHTVQVERNGFIEGLLQGTEHAGRGYRYLGERAYDRFIREE